VVIFSVVSVAAAEEELDLVTPIKTKEILVLPVEVVEEEQDSHLDLLVVVLPDAQFLSAQ
jgi:hypothetical protein